MLRPPWEERKRERCIGVIIESSTILSGKVEYRNFIHQIMAIGTNIGGPEPGNLIKLKEFPKILGYPFNSGFSVPPDPVSEPLDTKLLKLNLKNSFHSIESEQTQRICRSVDGWLGC